ncbi:hypothetical protein SK128_010046, partial [Halocaridina rubra]
RDVKGKGAKFRSLDRENDHEDTVLDPSIIDIDDPQPSTSGTGHVGPSAHDILSSVKDASNHASVTTMKA